MSRSEVRLIAGRFEVALGSELCIVPAAQVVIAVHGARSRNVVLDGRAARLSAGTTGLLAVDLIRSTGFHHLRVDDASYWFGTQDAKLGLEGVVSMLSELNSMGTGWSGQAIFSNGSGVRDPHVSYGWLDQHAESSLRAITHILDVPRSAVETTRVLRRRGGPGVLLAPTLRLLRSDPRRYLAPSSAGVVEAEGQSFEPLRVVARKRIMTLDTTANRRALAVLGWIDQLTREVVLASSNKDAVARARLWRNSARQLVGRPLALALGVGPIPRDPIQPEEMTDTSYSKTYKLARDLESQFGWSATQDPTSRLSYVDQSDSIYQAYVASRFARELALRQTSAILGASQPAFSGPRFDIYYDARPPASVLRSWRRSSDRPDDSRPDLLIHERDTGRVAVLDAKYRIGKDGRASEDSRKDVSAYMALYGLDAISIIYPGAHSSEMVVAGQGQRILELSVAPGVHDLSACVGAMESTLQIPKF